MGKRSSSGGDSFNDEFPLLDELGLYASSTTGDGNCLFRAVSDQVHGNEGSHAEFRRKAVAYLKEHDDHFAAFIGEFGESFEQYTKRMSRDGVYGGHLELVAMANVYGLEIAIYQADYMYVVHPTNDGKVSNRVHIAYHSWEHYSSVRQKSDRGLPMNVNLKNVSLSKPSKVVDDNAEIPRWKVEIVLRSVPDAPEDDVYELLRSKDYGDVIEELLTRQMEVEVSTATDQSATNNQSLSEDKPKEASSPIAEDSNQKLLAAEKGSREKAKAKRLTPAERRQARKERIAARKSKRKTTNSTADSSVTPAPNSQPPAEDDDDKVSVKVIHI